MIRGVGCPMALAVGMANSDVEFVFPISEEVATHGVATRKFNVDDTRGRFGRRSLSSNLQVRQGRANRGYARIADRRPLDTEIHELRQPVQVHQPHVGDAGGRQRKLP